MDDWTHIPATPTTRAVAKTIDAIGVNWMMDGGGQVIGEFTIVWNESLHLIAVIRFKFN